jgi:ferric-dicitrate binding protein FerR (iron transport regulator)
MNQEILYKFFKGQTTEEEEMALKAWIEENPENEHSFIEQRKLYDSLTLLKDENDLQGFLSRKKAGGSKHKFILFREILKIASIATIAFLAAYFLLPKSGEQKFTAMQTITVPAGQRINISLPDGTNVWLNARTTIQYPVSFNDKDRSVKLDGQAYFDVMHDEEIPFIVETDKGRVQVLGTKFDVLAYSGSDDFETALMDGSVEVSLSSNPNRKLVLTPDTKAYLIDGELRQTVLTDHNPYRWKEGLISFVECSFVDIMKEFEKSYGIGIVIENKTVQGYSYTGKFRITDGIDYALRVLQKDLHFTYSRDADNNVLYIK